MNWGDENDCDTVEKEKKITIDVGGVCFVSLNTTLKKSPYLCNLINANEDYIFIDRDPTLFYYILNYLRSNMLYLSTDDKNLLEYLKDEATFYGLDELVPRIQKCYVQNPIHELIFEMKSLFKVRPRTRQNDGGGW